MGWSANACRYTQAEQWSAPLLVPTSLADTDEVLRAFAAASKRLEDEGVFGIDGSLADGGLCSRSCADAITKATGLSPYAVEWTPERVKEIATKADWSFLAGDEEGALGSKLSAQAFVTICAEHNLGISTD